jgi:hypothetical protein
MQGKKLFLDQEVTRFRLSERVPPHNLYRQLAELVDWTFLYDETWSLYSHTGQPSLYPVVFFKLVLVGRLENLVQRPPAYRALCPAARYPAFLGLRGGRRIALALNGKPHPPAVSGGGL